MAGHVLSQCLVVLHDKQVNMKNKPQILPLQSQDHILKGVLVCSIKAMIWEKGGIQNVNLLQQKGLRVQNEQRLKFHST